jgi:membrane fusion protein, multidrug efflux system
MSTAQATPKMETATVEGPKKTRFDRKRVIIISSVLAILVIAGVRFWIVNTSYESTDNAQIDASIIPIRSSVSGYIKNIFFKDNEHVKKGQLLIEIDDTELRTKVAQAQAALENSRANLLSVNSNASSGKKNATAVEQSSFASEQNVEAAKIKWLKLQEDFKRINNLYNANVSTKSAYDAAKADVDVAKAQYEVAVNNYKSSQAQSSGAYSQVDAQHAQISLAEALVRQRESELILAKTQLGYAKVEAPREGIISRRSVENGQYISLGQPLCSEVDKESFWVLANFKETQMKTLKIGQEVDVKLDAYPDIKISGKIESFVGATGAKFSLLPPDNATGNFIKVTQRIPVRIAIIDYPKDKADELFPGLSAFVEVKLK